MKIRSNCAGASSEGLRAVRAVIFDVYGTLLEVGPPLSDASARWRALFERFVGAPPPIERDAFLARAQERIALHHAGARARGIAHPEVLWPRVVVEVLPELGRLPEAVLAEWIFEQMQCERVLRLQPGAVRCLRGLRARGVALGLASNSQAYTQRELREHLGAAGAEDGWFDPALCFRSFEHGFSKPDPHVFQMLSVRLQARGIGSEQTLMVGDRLDNDIEPARAFGWRTWLVRPGPARVGGEGDAGDLEALCAALEIE